MMDVFEDMVDDPEEFVVRSDEEAGKIKEDATWLLDQLRPSRTTVATPISVKKSDFDIRDEKVIYLDLAQQEGSVDSSTALTMQLLISLVYERAKVSEKEVVFYIDEARYIMQDAASLAFLETVFRHHRHHDLSIRLVTQTVDEFFEHAESEAILDQCAVKQFHRLDGMDKAWADEFGLNYAQMRFVQMPSPATRMQASPKHSLASTASGAGSRSKRCPRRNRSSTSSQPSNGEPHSPALARIRWTRTYRRSRRTLKAERQTTDNSHLSGRQQRLMVVQQEVATMREYLRVTLTSERLNPERLPQALESLHKLTSTDSTGLADKLNPLHSKTPLRFEFLARSARVQTTPSNSTTVLTTIWIRLRNVSGRSIPRRSTSSVPKSTSHPDSCSLWNSTERRSSITMSRAISRTSSVLTSNTNVGLTTTVKRGQQTPNQSRMEGRSATCLPTTSSSSETPPSNSPHQMRFPRISHSPRLPNQQ